MDIRQQIVAGKLVCPKTKQKLTVSADEQWLFSEDLHEKYILIDKKVPVMLIDPEWANRYMRESSQMMEQYSPASVKQKKETLLGKLEDRFYHNYRTKASGTALNSIFEEITDDTLCLSIGGGPNRQHPKLVNLNIGPFPNVDVVSDAHLLPYANDSVDAIYCEAVLEHLHNPNQAVKENVQSVKA